MEQRTTRNVTEFTAGAGFLDVKGTVKQVGSLIDGNFTLNSNGYEHEDLKDIDKSRTVGINVTVYPNVSYSQRDKNGNQVYVDGSNPKKTGTAVKTGLTYGETDRTREILATVGAGVTMNHDLSGVNRDPNRQVTEFEGRELKPVNVDLLAEYWATEAGRGKLRDMLEDAGRTTDGIRRILTTRDENGNLNILKSMEAESAVQKFMRIGYVDTRGKTQQQVKQELEARFGSLAKKGVKVYFYGEKDVDTSSLDNATKTKLIANGFAITEDGTVWINKEHVDSGKVIDFNTLTQHEISHIIFGKDSEYQAQYVEAAYREFLTGLARNGYAQDGSGITDYSNSMLTVQEIARLNGYTDEQMQEFFNEFIEGVVGKKNWRKIKNGVQANVKRIPIVGAATSKILTKVSQVDRKIAPEAGTKAGVATRRTVKIRTGIDTEKVVGKGIDKISQIKRRAAERNKPKRTVKKEEKEYLEYVAGSKGKRGELSGYQIKILGGNDKDGYLIYESGNTSKISLAQLRDMIDEGKIYRYDGFILKGYGITPQEARGNYENRVNNIRSGGIQMGISGYRVVQGAGGVTVAGGCIGLSKGLCTPLVAGIGIIGVSEITLGGSDFIEGTSTVAKSILNLREREYSASKEYHRLRNGQQQLKGYSSFEGFNPVKGGLEYINAPNWVYPTANGLSFAGSIATAPIRAVFKPIATSAKAAETVTRYNNGYTQKSTSSSVYDKGYAQRLETGNYTNSSAVYDASEKVYRYAPQPSNWNIGVANSITSTGNTYSYIPQVPGLSEPLRTGIIPLTTPESYKATEQITNTVRNTFGDETKGKSLFEDGNFTSKYDDFYEYEYNAYTNPGPLAELNDHPHLNFYGGRYNSRVLTEDTIYYRAGNSEVPYGRYFVETPPKSVIQVRIDSAVKPYWTNNRTGMWEKNDLGIDISGKSKIEKIYTVRVPAGTVIYEGPVAPQGGMYLGGMETNQIFLPDTRLPGIEFFEYVK